jgi:hypothetical protein
MDSDFASGHVTIKNIFQIRKIHETNKQMVRFYC